MIYVLLARPERAFLSLVQRLDLGVTAGRELTNHLDPLMVIYIIGSDLLGGNKTLPPK